MDYKALSYEERKEAALMLEEITGIGFYANERGDIVKSRLVPNVITPEVKSIMAMLDREGVFRLTPKVNSNDQYWLLEQINLDPLKRAHGQYVDGIIQTLNERTGFTFNFDQETRSLVSNESITSNREEFTQKFDNKLTHLVESGTLQPVKFDPSIGTVSIPLTDINFKKLITPDATVEHTLESADKNNVIILEGLKK